MDWRVCLRLRLTKLLLSVYIGILCKYHNYQNISFSLFTELQVKRMLIWMRAWLCLDSGSDEALLSSLCCDLEGVTPFLQPGRSSLGSGYCVTKDALKENTNCTPAQTKAWPSIHQRKKCLSNQDYLSKCKQHLLMAQGDLAMLLGLHQSCNSYSQHTTVQQLIVNHPWKGIEAVHIRISS